MGIICEKMSNHDRKDEDKVHASWRLKKAEKIKREKGRSGMPEVNNELREERSSEGKQGKTTNYVAEEGEMKVS